jgi:hypothetical protein
MKRLLALLLMAASPATAQVGPMTQTMTCAQARGLVAVRGAVVLSTSRTTYDRFVAHGGFCQPDEWAAPAWVPTRDTPQCPIAV